jgi:hypothetical protein
MTDVIDLGAERSRREQPDPEFIRQDEYGRPLYSFGVEYEFDDRRYQFQLWAYSWEDAEAKLAGIRASGKVFGQLYSAVPA